jgi:HD-like signal output (HDOD) protein
MQTTLPKDIVDRLPSPKGVALAITSACREEDVHMNKIFDLVRTDPALSGRLLAVANIATGAGIVTSVEGAIAKIGLKRVNQLALAFSLIDQTGAGSCANFDYAGFWNRSFLTAVASREMWSAKGIKGSAEDAFTGGLLGGIGKLGMATAYPSAFSDLLADHYRFGAPLLELERERLSIDHASLSNEMMTSWGIHERIAKPFSHVSSTTIANDELEILARHAWTIANELSRTSCSEVLESTAECREWLELDKSDYEFLLGSLVVSWQVWLKLISSKH